MVIFVMGNDRPERSNLARMLAITLGWDFVDADALGPTYVHGLTAEMRSAKSARLGMLDAALQYWVYNWQDVVVSCFELSEQERKLLASHLPLVKFIYLRSPERMVEDEFSDVGNLASPAKLKQTEASRRVLTVDPSRKTKEIIARIIAVMVLNRSSQEAVLC